MKVFQFIKKSKEEEKWTKAKAITGIVCTVVITVATVLVDIWGYKLTKDSVGRYWTSTYSNKE